MNITVNELIPVLQTAILRIETAWLILVLFVGSMGFLIASLVSFLQDLNQSPIAFKLDIGQ